ncbi:MAG: 4Fe-4S dicluster domain-containing protein [Archaeoglobaceae archaeon]
MQRREFLKCLAAIPILPGFKIVIPSGRTREMVESRDAKQFAMVVDVNKCIGCGKCVIACKTENHVPMEMPISRTWIEGYLDGKKVVMNTNENPFLNAKAKKGFYVPKLCNHCANAPCVNVCPVYARFHTKEGIVLVDKETCIGCKYCLIACPYGATFVHPEEKVTDKCTFCYHRLRKGLLPACVVVCPTGARTFGALEEGSRVYELIKKSRTTVLKPEAGTLPRVFYLNLDTVVEL